MQISSGTDYLKTSSAKIITVHIYFQDWLIELCLYLRKTGSQAILQKSQSSAQI